MEPPGNLTGNFEGAYLRERSRRSGLKSGIHRGREVPAHGAWGEVPFRGLGIPVGILHFFSRDRGENDAVRHARRRRVPSLTRSGVQGALACGCATPRPEAPQRTKTSDADEIAVMPPWARHCATCIHRLGCDVADVPAEAQRATENVRSSCATVTALPPPPTLCPRKFTVFMPNLHLSGCNRSPVLSHITSILSSAAK